MGLVMTDLPQREQRNRRSVQAPDTSEFGEAPIGAAACQYGNELDGLGDQGAWHRDNSFLDQLLYPAERTERRTGMNGSDAAGMTGAPGLQEIERFGASDFTDRNPIRSQAQRGANEIGERGDTVLGAKRHEIWGFALQLAGILDQHDAIGGLGDLRQQRVGKGPLGNN